MRNAIYTSNQVLESPHAGVLLFYVTEETGKPKKNKHAPNHGLATIYVSILFCDVVHYMVYLSSIIIVRTYSSTYSEYSFICQSDNAFFHENSESLIHVHSKNT